MGFKFMEAIGEKIAAQAKGDDEFAAALVEKVEESGLDVDDFDVEFAGGKATISGIAADEDVAEKTILVVGNTRGVAEVEADALVAGMTDAEKAEFAEAREAAKKRAEARDAAEARMEELKAKRELLVRKRKAQAAAARAQSKFYAVKRGDTLSKIAKEFYGDGSKYPTIFEANKPMLKDPDLIYPGQMLRIPPLGDE